MKNEWVYYLNLSNSLDSNFLELDSKMKENGLSLVPVNLEDVYSIVRSKQNIHIMIVVDKASKLVHFNKRIRKIMMLLLRRETINFYVLSSFERLDDKTRLMNRENYFFTSLPCSLSGYTNALARVINNKDQKINAWPGARRRVHISGEKF
jgi:hypothetical protein